MKSINIKFTTVEPLLQIDGSKKDPETGLDIITQKRSKFMVQIGDTYQSLYSPVYTSNGYRGLMRRIGTGLILKQLQKKGLSLGGETNFHLMNAGGGNNYQAQPYEVEKKVRGLNPLVSVFGTSLAIKGKIAVTDLVPMRSNEFGEMSLCYRENAGILYSDIIDVRKFIKKDDLLDRDGNAVFMSEEELIEWEKMVSENQEARAKSRKAGGDKIKKETIKHIQSREQVAAGVDFFGSIEPLVPLTDIEKGMLVRIFEHIVNKRLGSTAASGLGAVDYEIVLFDDSSITTERDKRFHSKISKRINLVGDTEKCALAFDEWLENITEENVQLDKILI